MKKITLRSGLIVLLIIAILFVGIYASFIGGLAYSRNLSRLEKSMHPGQQNNTLWISAEEDLYFLNDNGTLWTYVLWNGAWQAAELDTVGARFQILSMDDKPLLRGNFSMKREDQFCLQCSDDSIWEEMFANGRKRLILQRYDLQAYMDKLPFSYPK